MKQQMLVYDIDAHLQARARQVSSAMVSAPTANSLGLALGSGMARSSTCVAVKFCAQVHARLL